MAFYVAFIIILDNCWQKIGKKTKQTGVKYVQNFEYSQSTSFFFKFRRYRKKIIL